MIDLYFYIGITLRWRLFQESCDAEVFGFVDFQLGLCLDEVAAGLLPLGLGIEAQ